MMRLATVAEGKYDHFDCRVKLSLGLTSDGTYVGQKIFYMKGKKSHRYYTRKLETIGELIFFFHFTGGLEEDLLNQIGLDIVYYRNQFLKKHPFVDYTLFPDYFKEKINKVLDTEFLMSYPKSQII